jgi:hypothetical protein
VTGTRHKERESDYNLDQQTDQYILLSKAWTRIFETGINVLKPTHRRNALQIPGNRFKSVDEKAGLIVYHLRQRFFNTIACLREFSRLPQRKEFLGQGNYKVFNATLLRPHAVPPALPGF